VARGGLSKKRAVIETILTGAGGERSGSSNSRKEEKADISKIKKQQRGGTVGKEMAACSGSFPGVRDTTFQTQKE